LLAVQWRHINSKVSWTMCEFGTLRETSVIFNQMHLTFSWVMKLDWLECGISKNKQEQLHLMGHLMDMMGRWMDSPPRIELCLYAVDTVYAMMEQAVMVHACARVDITLQAVCLNALVAHPVLVMEMGFVLMA
jgi:hypothetical protein